jgi:hypothetical protein
MCSKTFAKLMLHQLLLFLLSTRQVTGFHTAATLLPLHFTIVLLLTATPDSGQAIACEECLQLMSGRRPSAPKLQLPHNAFERSLAGRRTHHSCNRTVLSSRYMVFDKKSMPMVACRLAASSMKFTPTRIAGDCNVLATHAGLLLQSAQNQEQNSSIAVLCQQLRCTQVGVVLCNYPGLLLQRT